MHQIARDIAILISKQVMQGKEYSKCLQEGRKMMEALDDTEAEEGKGQGVA